jgi:hypothetical protein
LGVIIHAGLVPPVAGVPLCAVVFIVGVERDVANGHNEWRVARRGEGGGVRGKIMTNGNRG